MSLPNPINFDVAGHFLITCITYFISRGNLLFTNNLLFVQLLVVQKMLRMNKRTELDRICLLEDRIAGYLAAQFVDITKLTKATQNTHKCSCLPIYISIN